MRISDWSSDVCSSDLPRHGSEDQEGDKAGAQDNLAVGAAIKKQSARLLKNNEATNPDTEVVERRCKAQGVLADEEAVQVRGSSHCDDNRCEQMVGSGEIAVGRRRDVAQGRGEQQRHREVDRKRVVEGKSVSVRVVLGGRRNN